MIKYDYTVTVTGNTAKLDKDIYLFRGNKNVHYYFAVKNASFNFKGATDLIEKTNAINAAVTVIKPNGVEVANAIAEVENGKIHLKVTEDLIDEEVEVGDFDLVFDLFDDTDGAVTIPKVTGQFHVLERPCTTPISELVATNTTNEVDLAIADYAIATYAEPVASTNADGTFAKKTWVAKEKITTAELNRMEEGIETVNSQLKDIAKQIENMSGGLDLSKLTISTESVTDGTKLVLTDGTITKDTIIPITEVTDEQLTSIIQSKIDDGTLSSIALGENSVSTSNIQDGAITSTKLNGVSVEKFDYIEYENCKITDTTGEIVTSTGKHVTRAYPVTPGNLVYMKGYYWNYNDCQGAYYDQNKNFLSSFRGGSSQRIHFFGTAPENAYFVRFTILDENKDIISFGNPLKDYPKNLCIDKELNKAISNMIGEAGLPPKSVNAEALNIIRKKSYNKIDYSTLNNSIFPLTNAGYRGTWSGTAKCYLEKGISYKTTTNITSLWYLIFYKDEQIVGTSKDNSAIFDSYIDDYVDYVHYYTFTLPNDLDFDNIVIVLAPVQAINDVKVVITEESKFGLGKDDYIEYSFTDDDLTNTVKYIVNKKEINGLDGNICIAMGDSYTAGMANILKNMVKKYGMSIDNRGIVSSTISGSSKGYQPMWERTKTLCEEYTANGTSNDVKLILFMGGANDGFGKDSWIGTGINDRNNEHIYGAMHTILNYFRKTFKNAKIIVTLQPSSYNRTVSSITDDSTAQALGFTNLAELQLLDDYQFSNYAMFVKEKAVKEVAEFYNCDIVDCCFNWHSVLNENDRNNYWNSDKLHLTSIGYQEVADAIENKILENNIEIISSYSITNILTNCTSNNNSTSIKENSSYNATITADDGYELSSVTVTMKGIDITSDSYSNGKVTVEKVIGDLIITATTIETTTE